MDVYVPLPMLKAALTMKGTVEDRDDLLQLALDAAHEAVDGHCGRRFGLDEAVSARTYELDGTLIREPDGDRVLVDDIGAVAGLIVEYGSDTAGWTVITTSSRSRPDNAITRGRPVTSLRYAAGAIPWSVAAEARVTAKWGWPAVPNKVKQATLLEAMRLYKRKESPEGVLGVAEWGPLRVSRVDPDVEKLLFDFVRPGLG